jgi:hypothetical protein
MESNLKDSQQMNKGNKTNIYNPDSYFIIDKNLFQCIICYDISPNLYETNCCGTLVCYNCKPYLQNSNCPVCKIKTDFKISKVAKRIICNSITECPLCGFTDIYDSIASHFFREHKDYILKSEKLEKDKKLFNFLSVYFCISLENKFFMHSHPLHLVSKEKDCVCFAGSLLGYKNCKMLDTLSENFTNKAIEDAKNTEVNNLNENLSSLIMYNSNENLNNNFNLDVSAKAEDDLMQKSSSIKDEKLNESEELKNLIMQKLIYFCSECEGFFCDNCLQGKDIWIPVQVHEHPLNLTKRDNGWHCDGKNLSDGCFNQNICCAGLARYRCEKCDFDLCEKCLMYYME